jgi:hypothetical protein
MEYANRDKTGTTPATVADGTDYISTVSTWGVESSVDGHAAGQEAGSMLASARVFSTRSQIRFESAGSLPTSMASW